MEEQVRTLQAGLQQMQLDQRSLEARLQQTEGQLRVSEQARAVAEAVAAANGGPPPPGLPASASSVDTRTLGKPHVFAGSHDQ